MHQLLVIVNKTIKDDIINAIKLSNFTAYDIDNFIIDFSLETKEDVEDFMVSYKASLIHQRVDKSEALKQKKKEDSLIQADQDEEDDEEVA